MCINTITCGNISESPKVKLIIDNTYSGVESRNIVLKIIVAVITLFHVLFLSAQDLLSALLWPVFKVIMVNICFLATKAILKFMMPTTATGIMYSIKNR